MEERIKTLYPKLIDKKPRVFLFALPVGMAAVCVFLTVHAILVRGLTRTDILVLGVSALTFLTAYIGIRNEVGILEDGILIPKVFWRRFVPLSDILYVRLSRGAGQSGREFEVHTNDFHVYFISEMDISNWERLEKVLTEDLKDRVELRN